MTTDKKSRVTEQDREGYIYTSIDLMPCGDPAYPYSTGYAVTRHGIVAIYFQTGNDCHTRFTFVYDGRMYQRTIAWVPTERGLLIRAGKFAREVCEA